MIKYHHFLADLRFARVERERDATRKKQTLDDNKITKMCDCDLRSSDLALHTTASADEDWRRSGSSRDFKRSDGVDVWDWTSWGGRIGRNDERGWRTRGSSVGTGSRSDVSVGIGIGGDISVVC
jgi:hypothetical protein